MLFVIVVIVACARSCLLLGIRCVGDVFVVCCLLCAVCCSLFVVCCLVCVVCRLLFFACLVLFMVCDLLVVV